MNTHTIENQREQVGVEQMSIKDAEFSKITQAVLTLSQGPISFEKLFGDTTFSPEQEKAAGVLGLGRMYSLFSKQVYDEVIDPSLKYDTGR
jgi:hypothetical protein